jgi:drug/metabolite transporter (DMT)-like permease
VPPLPKLALAAGAGVGGALGLAALYRGMAVGAMGIVAPISGLSPVVPLVVGLASGERPSELQLTGIAVALTGVLLVSREPSATGSRRAAGAGLALVAAAGFGLYFVLLDGAADASVPWSVTTARATAAALALLAALGAGAALRPPARLLPALASVGLADVAANAFFGLATTRGLLSVVSVLASLYPVVTVVLARVLIGERLGALQRVGGGAALAGAALIVAG